MRLFCTVAATAAATVGLVSLLTQGRRRPPGVAPKSAPDQSQIWRSLNNSLDNARQALDNAAGIIGEEFKRLAR